MSRDQEPFEDEEKSWETVRGHHSRIPPDNMDKGVARCASSDDDIIELVDVVREGDPIPDTKMDDLSLLLDQEEVLEKEEDFLGRKDENPNRFSVPLDETAEEELESDLTEADAIHDRFESPDFDFESPESLEEPTGDETTDISGEDLDLVMAGLVDELEDETSKPVIREKEPPSLSQERLEAVIKNAVTEVVERVVRETVAEVAERVIKEAIESLKQSLETKPE